MTLANAYARMKLRVIIPEDPDKCWLWTGGRTTKGYGNFGGTNGPKRWMLYCHRVSYEFHNGPIPHGLCVCHTCDVAWCVNPRHLFIGTKAENNRDMMKKKRHVFGSRHWWAKLSEPQAIEILNLLAAGSHPRRIAAMFGVSYSNITEITRNRNWKHLRHVDREAIAAKIFPRSDKGTKRPIQA